MANGSFGLSGLPTAPTTTSTGGANNPLSPVSAVVNSTAGFQAGDLIYNYAGDIAPVPGNFVGSATFPINADLPTYIQNVSFGQEVTPIVNTGYAYKNRNTAKLTSGNIVVVYLISNSASTSSNYPAYKIVNEEGTEIVAQTIIGTASFNSARGNISVCALTGGGFAVAWFENTNNYVSYAIYSNTGTVVQAPATDTGTGTVSTALTFVQTYARPDGSFIIAYSVTSSTSIRYKVFSATGVQVYAWTNLGSNVAVSYYFDLVVRSDNSFVFIFFNGGSQLHYQIRSATNVISTATTAITNATSITQPTGWGGATLLAGDITLVAYANGGLPSYSSISSAGVASAGVTYPFNTLGTNINYARPFTLANGNYILAYQSVVSTPSSPYEYVLNYAILDTSHALVSAVNQPLYSVTTALNAFFSFTQTTSYINLNYTPLAVNAGFADAPPNASTQINWIKFNPTTYQPIAASFASSSVGSTSAQAVSGYARSGSNPTGAAFLASSTSIISATTTQSTSLATLVTGQTTLDTSTSTYGLDTGMLSDGSVLVLYNVGGTIKLARISSAGVLLSNTTLATNGVAAVNYGSVRIAVLSSGKIACAYLRAGTSQITILILSSAYATLTSTTVSGVTWPNDVSSLDVAALTNDRFVFIYPSGSGPYFIVYNSSLTITTGTTAFNSDASPFNMTCAGTQNGFFMAYYHPASGGVKYAFYQENTSNVFTSTGFSTSGTSSRYSNDMRAVTAPNGTVQLVRVDSSTSNIAQSMYMKEASGRIYNATWGSAPNLNITSGLTLAITGSGDVVTIYYSSSTALRFLYSSASNLNGGNVGTYSVEIPSLSFNSSTNAFFTACGMTGHNVLFLAANSTNQLTYLIFNPASYTYSLNLTAGVTPSNTTAIGLSNGFCLVGVSSTDAPANGSGTVVINGPAQLSSSYPSTTAGQSFDFGNPVTFGAAGTISGRNVNLIGNV